MLLDHDPAYAFMPYPAVPVPHAPTGPLSGLTFAAKDLFDVAGYPTSAGSPHLLALSGIKTRTAPTVQRLLDAGARLVGKTITDELAFSMSGKNAHFGTPVNGGAPDRIPGGSSSGSAAAVSNGLCDFALGTDTGGSVRAPANHCGLFGIRPTHGRVSLELCHDLAPSFDTCGYFTRDGATFERVGRVLLGDDATPLPQAPRVLLARDAFGLLQAEVREALAPALRRTQAVLGEAREVEVATEGFTTLYWAMRYIQSREAWTVDGPLIERYRLPLGPGVADRFAFSKAVTDAQVAEARVIRAAFRKRFGALLDGAVLILPTMPDIAPLLSESDEALNDYRNNALNLLCLSVLSGLPQVSIPLASRSGAPLGLSLMGPAGSDLSLVTLARRIAESA
ncbi:amidase [Microvirga sp. SYSU G3D207]|uniref:Amidase n=2 Tax=Microvirga arsenatis TaxID=2692265 RepID=A0ABW9Z1V7_9HYPH|nr:amidase [Microvirga arsenatis]NBJ10467.1 amidase [Microvirga arsenatis]NBJ24634.1 amidase [Microvirga arsenatis]